MKNSSIILLVTGMVLFMTNDAMSQHKFKSDNGVFINNGLGYKFADHFELRISYHEDLYDNNRAKLGLTGTYTDFFNTGKKWGYSLSAGVLRLVEDVLVSNKFTPLVEAGLFVRLRISDIIDLVPTFETFARFPEMEYQAYGARLELPISIKFFGDKRLILGVGVELGRTNTDNRYKTKGFLGLMRLGFNF